MPTTKLPDEYIPFPRMLICGNTFENGSVPIAIDGRPLFLLGQNEMFWLQVRVGSDEWEYVVTPSEVTDSAFEVKRSERVVAIYFGPHLLIQANQDSDEQISVNHVDFRPIGLEVYGTPSELNIGGTQLAGNIFNGVHTMVNVG